MSKRRFLSLLLVSLLAIGMTGCVPKIWQEVQRQEAEYRTMTPEQLSQLSDDQLLEALYFRLLAQAEQSNDYTRSLNREQQLIYCAQWFQAELEDGGLCQFFVNSSRQIAPRMDEVLGELGAEEHRRLYEGFIRENGIDVNDLSSFRVRDNDAYLALTQKYPFDAFDDAYFALEPLNTYLIAFVRANLDKLV